MYANLRVKIGDFEAISACEVRIEDGQLIVIEDLNDGDSSHAEPGEEHRVPVSELAGMGEAVKITANF